MSATPSSLFPAPKRASSVPSSAAHSPGSAAVPAIPSASSTRSVRGRHLAGDEAAAAECAAERLHHPLEILMDSPRLVRAFGIAVPLLANAVWRVAEAARTELAI